MTSTLTISGRKFSTSRAYQRQILGTPIAYTTAGGTRLEGTLGPYPGNSVEHPNAMLAIYTDPRDIAQTDTSPQIKRNRPWHGKWAAINLDETVEVLG